MAYRWSPHGKRVLVYVGEDHPIYDKLGVAERAAAVAEAMRCGLLE